jgi:CubicO group peptidase (beta-lactamase class C family)
MGMTPADFKPLLRSLPQVLIDQTGRIAQSSAQSISKEDLTLMAFRNFDNETLSRRSLLRAGAYTAAGGALATMPATRLLAHEASAEFPAIAAMIEKYVGSGKVANILVTLGLGTGKHAHHVSKGTLSFSSKKEADLDSLYRIYSMTKPITGMATMMLIDDGKLGLDQPVAEILPAYANMRVLKDPAGALEDTVPAERPITIRQLLTHTAGLGYNITGKGPIRAAFGKLGLSSGQISKFPIPGVAASDSIKGLDKWADTLATLPLMYQPGTRWSYSASIDLLGRVIEVASGMSFDAFLQQRMFDPLGMDSTYWQVPASELGRLTDNYGVLNGVPLPVDPARNSIYSEKPPLIWGGSGLVCSPRDYDRFQRMVLGYGKVDGKRVMGELAVRVGVSNILPKGVTTKGTWVAGEGFGAGGRSVAGTYGWGGAAGTLSSVDFGKNMRGALFTQYLPAESYPIRKEFLAALAKDTGAMQGAVTGA